MRELAPRAEIEVLIPKAYSRVVIRLKRYWMLYGGVAALIRSPYLHIAAFLAVISWATWSNFGWWTDPISVIPSILGFSLGALTIFIGFGNDSFRNAISGSRPDKPDKPSPYLKVIATLFHLIVVQVLALVGSFISKSLYQAKVPRVFEEYQVFLVVNDILRILLWGIGYLLFLYGLLLVLSALIAIFSAALHFDDMRTLQRRAE